MKKLSILLWTSLIALGLLVTSNANAMTYTVNGNSTSVAIPSGISWITIKRCSDCEEIEFKNWSTGCSITRLWWVNHIECTKIYDENGTYTVNVNSSNTENTFSTLYLSNANITSISDFDGFKNIWSLYLTDNPNITLNTNTFSTLNNDVRIYLTNNGLTSFTTSVSNIKWLYLNSNELTTIPNNIRNLRNGNYIELSPNVKYGNFDNQNNKKFYLNDNKINFVDITTYPSSNVRNTSYTFERFWFSHEHSDWSSTYKYTLTKGSETIEETTSNTSATVENLTDWSYRFEVCINNITDNNVCDYVNFTVDLPSSISITSPTQDQEITSKSHTFTWNWSHPYLEEFCYELTSNKWYSKNDCQNKTNKSFSVSNLTDWTYDFRVSMKNGSGTELDYDNITFTVKLNRSVTIDTIPNPITSKNHTFSRIWTAEDFLRYRYSLTKNDSSYSTWWTTNSNNFSVSDLTDWTYTLTVVIEWSWWSGYDTKSVNVDINKSLSVNSNPSWTITRNNVTWVNVTISWDWDNDWFNKYSYRLTKDWELYKTWASTNKSDSKEYVMLPSWVYNFYIDMLNSANWVITSNETSFTIVIPTTLTVDSPTLDWNNVTLWRTWFAENFHHYEYILNRTDVSQNAISWTRNTYHTWFTVQWLHYGNYTLTVNMKDSWGTTLISKNVSFQISDNLSLSSEIYVWNTEVSPWSTINSRSATFTRSWQSEDLAWFYYEISGTTFKNETYKKSWIQTSNIDWELYKTGSWSISLEDLQTWTYRFTVKMLSWNNVDSSFNERSIDFNVFIPASLTIISPTEWATITSDKTTFSRTWYSDVIEKYGYALTYWDQPVDTNNFTNSTSITSPTLKNWNYTLTVWIISGVNVAEDTVHFTVAIPPKVSWWSSSKTHYTNNLKLSLWNDSPVVNEWIKLIVKIDDNYVGKVTFPKLQHYSADTEKREDIPVTSKNYVSDYSDDAKLGYIKFSSSDDWRKDLEQFIKFSKNWYYRIYAEDKDWYDTYIEFKVSGKTTQTVANSSWSNTTTNNTNTIDSIIQRYIPEVYQDTSEEVYIARSCKKYTITYSNSLNVYTSPNLNMSEYFVSKDYFKRYIDSKNKYQSGCPTNIGWISTNYSDRTNDDTRYTAPNGKVYFITWRDWNYYSNELNKELKTPTSFRTIQELKYYIRDRNPLINMATLWPVN